MAAIGKPAKPNLLKLVSKLVQVISLEIISLNSEFELEVGEPAQQVACMTGFQVSESSSELSPREYIRNYQIGLARLIVEL